MKRLWIVGVVLLWASSVSAQPAANSMSIFQWTQSAPDAATAQGYTFRYYVDGSTTGTVLSGVTCTSAASVITCEVPMPSGVFMPGQHTIQLSAGTPAGESGKSSPFAFEFADVIGTPLNVHFK